jgi:integrase
MSLPELSQQASHEHSTWRWPIDLAVYDRTPALSETERAELAHRFHHTGPRSKLTNKARVILHRLVQPMHDVLTFVQTNRPAYYETIRVMLIEMFRRNKAFWAWSQAEWLESIQSSDTHFAHRYGRTRDIRSRRLLPVLAYLLEVLPDTSALMELFEIPPLARKIFGQEAVAGAVAHISGILHSWGYQQQDDTSLTMCLCYLLLRSRSPSLADLSVEVLEAVDRTCTLTHVQRPLFQVSRALFAGGMIERALPNGRGKEQCAGSGTDGSVDPEWLRWCERWKQQNTQQERDGIYYQLLKVGRWLKAFHPTVTSPHQWTYDLAAKLVAAVNEMKVGEWSSPQARLVQERIGQPLRPHAKANLLGAMRVFLRDCQEWEWIPTRLNPHRAFQVPRALQNQLGPNPRVVDKPLWAKLLWAAMNLEAEDLPLAGSGNRLPAYPLEMVRAIAVVWCFAALRSDEIVRLRVGCIRWQHEDVMVPETGERLPKDATCFLDVPVNKTLAAYTKPVHPLVGKRINAWEQVRPEEQPRSLDEKTSQTVQFLFAYRGQRVSKGYLNTCLIPLLCKKAGIPEADSRGSITSHRARATIASMLYNAKEPLDIFQLQKYLGHKYLSSTQHYTQVDPTKLASDVAKAGYLEQNLATIEVLLDQAAVRSGAVANGAVWKYYDLGHGFCTNDYWADCKHRMACARCPFYRPKESLQDQLVEGKANLVRMLEFVKLTDEERLLVTEGIELHQALIERLADVPTPAGPTPRELEVSRQGEQKVIPLKAVQRSKKKQQGEP